MKDLRIIVTGGAGFIGSTIVKTLAENSNEIIVLDDLSSGNYSNIEKLESAGKIRFIKGSITDLELLNNVSKDVDYIFHHAAIASVPKSVNDPKTTNDVNLNGTLNVLMASRKNNIKKVIFASSSSVYGETTDMPIKENLNPQPLSPYAVTKLASEYYCNAFTEVYGLPTVALRYFNVYGPRQDPLSDYAAVIPIFIRRTLDDKKLVVYGDGEQIRDFVFVKDVVKANILAAESKETGVFNIAGGKRITINDLASLIIRLCEKKLEIEYADPRPGDIKLSLADISKAKEKLGYIPRFSLEEGLNETLNWFKNQDI